MPKRDHRYMEAQRTLIAKAALAVLLEKGVYATSLRDICKAADVSMGALYTHYATKEDVIVAACALDHAIQEENTLATTWEDYVRLGIEPSFENPRSLKRLRLSLQFAAEITQMEVNPAGLGAIYLIHRRNIALNLSELRRRRIIRLPHGLDLTTEVHQQIFVGAVYQFAADKEACVKQIIQAANLSLSVTAGLIAPRAELCER